MARSKVYMIPLDTTGARDKLGFSVEAVMGHRSYNLVKTFLDGDLVGIKLPYTEYKEHAVVHPELLSALVTSLKSRKRVVFVCDTAARHFNKKANAIEHMEAMMAKGVTYERTGAPFAMLDGINGAYEMSVDLGRKKGGKFLLAGELQNTNGMVITTTPKPLGNNCFEGALFNMGVGLGAKRGKIQLYSSLGPQVNVEKCYLCKKCIYICPVGAIHKGPKHVIIDQERCINCGKCVDLTRFGGITYH
ncbi:4Fe-4S binding protein, partial [Myxococcota bacterium]|nr:4Fe-4S binding protein [Myxococcota bacterium]MBU1537021.1 4Fe-4S binding protein [Myxococcota bacterium]